MSNLKKVILEELNRLTIIESLSTINEYDIEWDYSSGEEVVKINNTKLRADLDHELKRVKDPNKLDKFLGVVSSALKNSPDKLKRKVFKYIITSSIGLIGATAVNSVVNDTDNIQGNLKTELLSKTISKSLNSKATAKNKDEVKPFNVTTVPNSDFKQGKTLSMSEKGIKKLKRDEGSPSKKGEPVLKVGNIEGGNRLTVGWGHAEKIKDTQFKDGQVISVEQAEALFKEDLKTAELGVQRMFNRWDKAGHKGKIVTQSMFDAMVSMAFNMGISGLLNSDFIQLVKKGDYINASKKILTTSTNGEGDIDLSDGLKNRRQGESKQFSEQGLNFKIKTPPFNQVNQIRKYSDSDIKPLKL
jgi:GH24 family phage-related lysozyme (muramidase)